MIPRTLSIAFMALLLPFISMAQAGKDCNDPFVVTTLPFVQAGMTTNGFGDDYPFSPCGSPFIEGDDLVITYTPIADESISILLQNASEFTGLHLLDECPSTAGTACLAKDLQVAAGVRLIDDFLVAEGETYYIIISTFPDPQSTDFDLSILSNGPPPAGTVCSNPKVLDALPYFELGTNTADFGNHYSGTGPCQTNNYLNSNEIIYTYTPTDNEAIAIELTNISDFFAGLQVMNNCPDASPLCIASAVNNSTTDDLVIENLFVEKDQTYYFVVSTFETPQSVIFDLAVFAQQICRPPFDVVIDNITDSSAQGTWSGEALFWTTQVVKEGTPAGPLGDRVDVPNKTQNGLQADTNYEFYLQSHCTPASLMITGVFDGPRSGGTPKGVELYALHDIADLSKYGIGSANNGGGSDGEEYTFPALAIDGGSFLFFASDSIEFNAFFGFDPQFSSPVALINGNDAVELFFQGEVIDQFGFIDVNGTSQIWEYKDGWAHRKNEQRNNNGQFRPKKWTYSGIDELEGGATNATCDVPYPAFSFNGVAPIPSVWSGPFPFRTSPEPVMCNAPINLGILQISNTLAELTWETTATNSIESTLSWGLEGVLPENGMQLIPAGNNHLLTGLSPSTSYDFYVSENCDVDGISLWAGPFTFTTSNCSLLGNVRTNPIEITALPFVQSAYTAACFTNTQGEISADVFYTYTTGNCEYSLRLNTCSDLTDFDTYLYLLDENGLLLYDNDESPEGTCDKTLNGENRFSFLEVPVSPNTTYLIMVEGFGPNAGNYELTIEEGSISPIGIGWNIQEVTCKDDQDGKIELELSGGASPYSVIWNTGANSEVLENISADSYVVSVEDACGHIDSATIILQNPDTLTLEATSFPTDQGASNGYLIAKAIGGTPPYSYIWDDGTTTASLINLDAGEYCVMVTDDRGCTAILCTAVSVNTSLADWSGLEEFQLFPNPTSDQISLEISFAENQDLQLQLVDVTGRVVFEKKDRSVLNGTYVFDLSTFSDGVYFLKIKTGDGVLIRRVLKQ